jgi:hypothetical protein
MKTVTFLKDHLDKKGGDSIEVSDERAHYFERTGVAKETVEDNADADDSSEDAEAQATAKKSKKAKKPE